MEWSNYTELLTEEEMSQRKALLSSCTSAEDAAIVEDLFIRIATEREANRDKWEAKLIEDEAKGVDDTSGDKKRRTTSFKVCIEVLLLYVITLSHSKLFDAVPRRTR